MSPLWNFISLSIGETSMIYKCLLLFEVVRLAMYLHRQYLVNQEIDPIKCLEWPCLGSLRFLLYNLPHFLKEEVISIPRAKKD